MRDRLWQEGWRVDVDTGILRRIKDGRQASGFYAAAEIEAAERNITTSQFLRMNGKFKMIPLADAIPPPPPMPQEFLGDYDRDFVEEAEETPQDSAHPMLILAYISAAAGCFAIISSGNAIVEAAGTAGVLVGAAVVGFWLART